MGTPVYDRIKELCDQKGIALSTLEAVVGLGKGSTQKWRRGSSPSTDSLLKMAEYFNVSMDYLAGRTDTVETADDLMSDDGFVSLKRALKSIPKSKRKNIADLITVAFSEDFE